MTGQAGGTLVTEGICRAALEQTLLFGALDDTHLARLAGASRARHYGRGQHIAREGEPGGDLFVVADGRIKVGARSPDGGDLLLAVASVGDTVGELSLFDHGPRSATVEAVIPSVVVTTPGQIVQQVMEHEPDLAVELLRQQAAMIRRMNALAIDLVYLDLPHRVAKFLLERVGHDGLVDLGMSQADVAAAIGGVRQSVNSALQGFQRRGWIRIDGRCVTVRDRAALTDFAMESAS
jgi:CRP-like cAMP-binding protein